MKAHDRAVNQQLPGDVTSAEISTEVVSNVQLRSVQLYLVLIMLCSFSGTVNRTANAPRSWSTKAWRMIFQAYSPMNNARLVVLRLVVLAFPLDTNDVMAEAGDAMDVNAILKRSLKGASKGSGKSKDPEFVCFYYGTK